MGEEGGPLYKPYRYVPFQRVKFWRRFSLEWNQIGFSRELRERMKVFIGSIRGKEREICEFKMDFKKSFFVGVLI